MEVKKERMITIMSKFEIISLKLNGWSNCRIEREFNVSRNTIRKYWNEYQARLAELLENNPDLDVRHVIEEIVSEPRYDSSHRRSRVYNEDIDQLLNKILGDEEEKRKRLGPSNKQMLTQRQICQMIWDAGYRISETTIRTKIREKRDQHRECFIRQQYEYAERFEYDFGEVRLFIKGKLTKGFLAVLTAPASGFRWAYLYHNAKMDVFLDSQVRFFEMLGGCFREGVYDNMRNVVSKFIGKNEKQLNKELIKLAAYYGFSINVTNCFSGNEKGNVEEAVKFIRNRVFATRYEFDSFHEAAAYLEESLKELNRNSSIEEEKKCLSFYRPKYEAARIESLHVNKYSFIQIDTNFYSVPDYLVDKYVTVKIYPNDIDVYYRDQMITTHHRESGKKETYIDIRHYLNTFLKKPGALRNSTALNSVPELKSLFDTYFKEKPKDFIDILYSYRDSTIEQIIEQVRKQACVIPFKDNWVAQECDRQIQEIAGLFIGGDGYVH